MRLDHVRELADAAVRRGRHGLEADGESDLDLVVPDLVRDRLDGHEARRAEPVDHLNRDRFRDAGGERRRACIVRRLGREHRTDTDVAYLGRINVETGQEGLRTCQSLFTT